MPPRASYAAILAVFALSIACTSLAAESSVDGGPASCGLGDVVGEASCGCADCVASCGESGRLADWFDCDRACYDAHERRGLADKHAPAGLMGDHAHHRGEWMFEYKYMQMYMNGNRAGKRSIPVAATFGFDGTNNAATPTGMTMEMHMIHIMYGWRDNVTLYVMPMLTSLTMDHLRSPGFPNPGLQNQPFTTHNSGISDLALGALWRIYESDHEDVIVNLGLSIPTGNIDRTTTVPTGVLAQELPYPMRLGSGTVNLRPGITYKRYLECGSFGAQYQADLPVGTNREGYATSKEHRFNAWYSWLPHDRVAFSFRVEGLTRSNFAGADPGLNPAIISTSRPDMRGGDWINFGYGSAVLIGNGYLLNAEVVHPVYQYLDGIQLEQDWWFFASVSKGF